MFYSQLNHCWTVTISTPVIEEEEAGDGEGKFLGVIGLSVDVHISSTRSRIVRLPCWSIAGPARTRG